MNIMTAESISALKNVATELRIDSIQSTTEAGSGHPTTCMSAAEIVATLFFGEMRFDPKNPQNPDNDRFVLSKGHAAPILYAAWAHAGLFPARGPAQAAPARLRPRRAPDAAAVVRRRRDRIARSGHLRRGRDRAQRAPHRLRLPHLRAARRRRDGRRLGLGGGRRRALPQARQPLRHHRRQRARSEPGTRSSTTRWTRLPRAGTRSAGTRSSSTATTSRRCCMRSPPRAPRRTIRR